MGIKWHNIAGHEKNRELLSRALETGKLSHAYLFSGDTGSGKLACALQLVSALFCQNSGDKPCFTCSSCQRIHSHSHPDFRYLFPLQLERKHRDSSQKKLTEEGWRFVTSSLQKRLNAPYGAIENYEKSIPVDWIREAGRTIARGPVESDRLAVIIEGIDTLKKESANALLKTLEEPPDNTYIILLCRSLERVLPTIISRSQILRFGLVERERIVREVERRGIDVSPEKLEEALLRGNGCPGRIYDYLEDEGEDEGMPLLKTLYEILYSSRFSTSLERARGLEDFVYRDLKKDFTRAAQVLSLFIEDFRIRYLTTHNYSAEYILQNCEADVYFSDVTQETAERIISSVEDALESIQKHTPLLLVFAELYFRISDTI
jgi:DNA polymerase III delta' subunit